MVSLVVNGRSESGDSAGCTETLLQFLRYRLGLTGTKEGCAEGDCGACTVALRDRDTGVWRAVNSCLVLLPMVDGHEIVTVEGLHTSEGPHPVQRALVEHLGSQCGYCTPGVVMSMFEACYRTDLRSPWQLDDQMCGNLCRCTGYRPIRAAVASIAGRCPNDRFLRLTGSSAGRTGQHGGASLVHSSGNQRFFTPSTFESLWPVLSDHPDARIVAGGTDLSLLVTKQFQELPTLVSVEGIPALRQIEKDGDRVSIGATVTLADLETFCAGPLPAVERMLRFFGSRQIKNRGTVGGNLCNASPIGDLPPILLALDTEVVLRSASGIRTLPLDAFFLSYRKTALRPGEILERVVVPIPSADTKVTAYKVSKRQELDISTVALGVKVQVQDGMVTEVRVAYGGLAAIPKRAQATESALLGKPWTEETVLGALDTLDEEFTPIDDHRGSAWYRRTVAKNLLHGFYWETAESPSPRHPHRPTGTVLASSS